MSSQGHDGPRAVGLDVPDPDGLVMGTGNDPSPVKLNTGNATSVTLKCSDMTLT